MDSKTREKYTFVVALLAAFLTFSAFKDNLTAIQISFGPIQSNLLIVGIVFAIGLSLSVYFVALAYLMQKTRFEGGVLYTALIRAANGIYFFAMCIPLVAGLVWLINGLMAIQVVLPQVARPTLDVVMQIASALVGIIATVVSALLSKRYTEVKEDHQREESMTRSQNDSVERLDEAERLFAQQFYASATLEAFKAVESKIKVLVAGQYGPYLNDLQTVQIMKLAVGRQLITSAEAKLLKQLQELRNKAAHSGGKITKTETQRVLDITRQLLVAWDERYKEWGTGWSY